MEVWRLKPSLRNSLQTACAEPSSWMPAGSSAGACQAVGSESSEPYSSHLLNGWDRPSLTFIYRGLDCGSFGLSHGRCAPGLGVGLCKGSVDHALVLHASSEETKKNKTNRARKLPRHFRGLDLHHPLHLLPAATSH